MSDLRIGTKATCSMCGQQIELVKDPDYLWQHCKVKVQPKHPALPLERKSHVRPVERTAQPQHSNVARKWCLQ